MSFGEAVTDTWHQFILERGGWLREPIRIPTVISPWCHNRRLWIGSTPVDSGAILLTESFPSPTDIIWMMKSWKLSIIMAAKKWWINKQSCTETGRVEASYYTASLQLVAWTLKPCKPQRSHQVKQFTTSKVNVSSTFYHMSHFMMED